MFLQHFVYVLENISEQRLVDLAESQSVPVPGEAINEILREIGAANDTQLTEKGQAPGIQAAYHLRPGPRGCPASGVGFGTSRVGQQHRHVPDGWLPAVRYLVEELGVDVNVRDADGFSAMHNAAARGDNATIEFLIEHGADVTFISRRGQTTIDMANGPQQRVQPFPETIALLERFGAINNHNCISC